MEHCHCQLEVLVPCRLMGVHAFWKFSRTGPRAWLAAMSVLSLSEKVWHILCCQNISVVVWLSSTGACALD